MDQSTFSTIEDILRANNIPIPSGRGREKLDAIRQFVRSHPMSEDVRERLKNLLSLG